MTDAIAMLERLIAEECRALASGDLGAVAALAPRKQAALDRLPDSRMTKHRLNRLKEKAQRAHMLLAASLEGIAAAQARMGDVRQVRSGLTTYDSLGRKAEVPSGRKSGVERKA